MEEEATPALGLLLLLLDLAGEILPREGGGGGGGADRREDPQIHSDRPE